MNDNKHKYNSKKNVVVLGAGESGVGAAVLAKQQGWNVWVFDHRTIPEIFRHELQQHGIAFEENQHSTERMRLDADLVIKSPGIPQDNPLIVQLNKAGKQIISEIEFAGYYNKAKTICITGSNGKTTTTLLTYHILKKAGIKVSVAGNMGESFARKVATEKTDWFVLELSSFQLDGMNDFHPNIAVLLNITPDHLDRYNNDFQAYINSKMRILQNMTSEDYFIYNTDDPIIEIELAKRTVLPQLLPFSLSKHIEIGGYASEQQLIINTDKQSLQTPFIMSIHELALKGKHNTQNSLAASVAARLLEIRKESIRESLTDFVNVEHRLEFVAKVNGIEFINDSKATNVNATWFALESMEKPTVWIAGGQDKGNDYTDLIQLVRDRVKAIICLGKDNSKIIDTFSNVIEPIVEVESTIEAVGLAYRLAQENEVVLLSPACASFDRFTDFAERGNAFKAAVRSL